MVEIKCKNAHIKKYQCFEVKKLFLLLFDDGYNWNNVYDKRNRPEQYIHKNSYN